MTRSSLNLSVELIYDSDCPNVDQARANLLRAMRTLGLSAHWKEWCSDDPDIPEHARRRASPTILVDGRDVADSQPLDGTSGCRIYASADGLAGAPSTKEIVAAINASRTPDESRQ